MHRDPNHLLYYRTLQHEVTCTNVYTRRARSSLCSLYTTEVSAANSATRHLSSRYSNVWPRHPPSTITTRPSIPVGCALPADLHRCARMLHCFHSLFTSIGDAAHRTPAARVVLALLHELTLQAHDVGLPTHRDLDVLSISLPCRFKYALDCCVVRPPRAAERDLPAAAARGMSYSRCMSRSRGG